MPLHRFPPRLWAAMRMREGICARLPQHYLASLQDDTPPTPVHWEPHGLRYRRNPRTGQRERVQDVPVPVYYPPAANEGLWGGEGWVRGFRYARGDKLSTRLPKTWKPQLFKRQQCAKALGKIVKNNKLKTSKVLCTIKLLQEGFPPGRGADTCVTPLQTPRADMCSKLGMDLKRTMLLRLARRDPALHPHDPARREAIYDKYKVGSAP
ncbi:RM28 protein, partial [Calcarius ornatus]|nr:RM28 protein [Calcarius ornatus]